MTQKLSTAESLRLMADWYEAHPDMPPPTAKIYASGDHSTKDGARHIARMLGTFEKGGGDMFLDIKKLFGSVPMVVSFFRWDICIKRVVQREIIEWDCPPLMERPSDTETA